jgi:MoaA/NifB/PqqE/SkfB family radical SAM enzyme
MKKLFVEMRRKAHEKRRFESRLKEVKQDLHLSLIRKIYSLKYGKDILLKKFEEKLYGDLVESKNDFPKSVQLKKYYFITSILRCAKRNIEKGWVSKEVADRVVNTLVKLGFGNKKLTKDKRKEFKKEYGVEPPTFIVLSPTQRCNLNCTGCYASAKINASSLDYETVDKVVDESYNKWGNRFMTISGGEPLMYKDRNTGKTLFDIWREYSDMFFLFYTNGTLINERIARELARLGNVTPAISLEGFEKETDERRGKGIFKKVQQAVENLKKAGVIFGVSVTATAKNTGTAKHPGSLLKDDFYDYIFKELGASYMWMFQLMPIGQATKDMEELMVTPEQRVKLFRKWEWLLEEKHYCIADFWNSGMLSNGCIGYGRPGGYLYVDWDGKITPCVFVPFYQHNIKELLGQGKGMSEALLSDLFKKGREWQKNYGLSCTQRPNNWLMPCSIRDHWMNFKKQILNSNVKPQDESAKQALQSENYTKVMKRFDETLERQTQPIWEKEFLKGQK